MKFEDFLEKLIIVSKNNLNDVFEKEEIDELEFKTLDNFLGLCTEFFKEKDIFLEYTKNKDFSLEAIEQNNKFQGIMKNIKDIAVKNREDKNKNIAELFSRTVKKLESGQNPKEYALEKLNEKYDFASFYIINTISDFLSYYMKKFLFNKKNIDDLGNLLGYDLKLYEMCSKEFFEFNDLLPIDFYDEKILSNDSYKQAYELNVLFYKYLTLSTIYNMNNGKDRINRIFEINKEIVNLYSEYVDNQLEKDNVYDIDPFDLFSISKGYDNIVIDKNVNPEDKDTILFLDEITDKNSPLGKLSSKEVAYFLFRIVKIDHSTNKFLSSNENHCFKDLSVMSSLLGSIREKNSNLSMEDKNITMRKAIAAITSGNVDIPITDYDATNKGTK